MIAMRPAAFSAAGLFMCKGSDLLHGTKWFDKFLFLNQLLTFPIHPPIEPHVQNDAENRGGGGGEADACQAGVRLDAHVVGQGQPDQEGLH